MSKCPPLLSEQVSYITGWTKCPTLLGEQSTPQSSPHYWVGENAHITGWKKCPTLLGEQSAPHYKVNKCPTLLGEQVPHHWVNKVVLHWVNKVVPHWVNKVVPKRIWEKVSHIIVWARFGEKMAHFTGKKQEGTSTGWTIFCIGWSCLLGEFIFYTCLLSLLWLWI